MVGLAQIPMILIPRGTCHSSVQLEFGLRVHFAVWPLLQSSEQMADTPLDLVERLKQFKGYLETRGAQLASESAFLRYYALPYVNPQELRAHPSFEHLFSPECTAQQRLRLDTFLQSLPVTACLPKLYSLYNAERQALDQHLPPATCHPVARVGLTQLLVGSNDLGPVLPDSTELGMSPDEKRQCTSQGISSEPADPIEHRGHIWQVADRCLQDASARMTAVAEAVETPEGQLTVSASVDKSPTAASPASSRHAAEISTPQLATLPRDGIVPSQHSAAWTNALATAPDAAECLSPVISTSQTGTSPETTTAASIAGSGNGVGGKTASLGSKAVGDSVHRHALSAAKSARTTSVTRSFMQQALLPAVDWSAVQLALTYLPSDAVACLLQVCLLMFCRRSRVWLQCLPACLQASLASVAGVSILLLVYVDGFSNPSAIDRRLNGAALSVSQTQLPAQCRLLSADCSVQATATAGLLLPGTRLISSWHCDFANSHSTSFRFAGNSLAAHQVAPWSAQTTGTGQTGPE
jgi:hypothetical protein